jgi:hypothetical protein
VLPRLLVVAPSTPRLCDIILTSLPPPPPLPPICAVATHSNPYSVVTRSCLQPPYCCADEDILQLGTLNNVRLIYGQLYQPNAIACGRKHGRQRRASQPSACSCVHGSRNWCAGRAPLHAAQLQGGEVLPASARADCRPAQISTCASVSAHVHARF